MSPHVVNFLTGLIGEQLASAQYWYQEAVWSIDYKGHALKLKENLTGIPGNTYYLLSRASFTRQYSSSSKHIKHFETLIIKSLVQINLSFSPSDPQSPPSPTKRGPFVRKLIIGKPKLMRLDKIR